MAKCPHCDRQVRAEEPAFRYEMSKQVAHLRCVSVPSASETDVLLFAYGKRYA